MTASWLLAVPVPSPSPAGPAFGAGVIGFSFLLSVVVWAPAVAALVVAILPTPQRRDDRRLLGVAFWTTALFTLLLGLIGYQQFQAFVTGVQFEERLPWLPAIGAEYHLGIDGIGMSLLLLNGLVAVACVLASWEVRTRVREYFVLLLLTQAALNGVVVARDFFVLFLFWAAATVPVALLVAGWGGPRRAPGAGRLVAYWGAGSAALLGAGLLMYTAAGATSFDLDALTRAAPSPRLQVVIGVLVVVAAASRLPLVPLHGWARDVFADAPAGVAVLVAGAASREGGYLLVRLLAGAGHDGARLLAPFLGLLAAITVVYAALAAMRAVDLRRLGAYLALVPGGVTGLGVAGLTPLSLDGAVLSLFAGGLAAALLTGACATFAERAQARSLALARGLAGRMPKLSWLLVGGVLGALGLPFMATFTALLLVFYGSLRTQPAAAVGVAAGLALAAAAAARLLHRTLFGAPHPEAPAPSDSSLAESWYLGILIGALLWVGLVPGGPKLAGIPLFDPGLVNVVNSATAELSAAYAPPAAPPSLAPAPVPAGGAPSPAEPAASPTP